MNKKLVSFRDLVYGLYFGFPACCVMHYYRLGLAGKSPGSHTRETLDVEWGSYQYVRCYKCHEANHGLTFPTRREQYKEFCNKFLHWGGINCISEVDNSHYEF